MKTPSQAAIKQAFPGAAIFSTLEGARRWSTGQRAQWIIALEGCWAVVTPKQAHRAANESLGAIVW